MGTARLQGALWGARAQDWAAYTEQVSLPLFGAALDAARVTAGTRVLDAGCGAGLLSVLASLPRRCCGRGRMPRLALISIARQRVPQADVREADLEALPFPTTLSTPSWSSTRFSTSQAFARPRVSWCELPARAVVCWSRPGGRLSVASSSRPSMPELAPLLPPSVARRRTFRVPERYPNRECARGDARQGRTECRGGRRSCLSFHVRESGDVVARQFELRFQPGGDRT